MVVLCNWPLYAFLHGDLVKEVYIEQPPDLLLKGVEQSGMSNGRKQSGMLIDLKRSPQAWFGMFSTIIQ